MSTSENRRYRRIALDLPARIVVNAIDEYEGRLINISPGDMALKSEAIVIAGDAAVVYIRGLDVIEGTVARVMPDGFALSFLLSKRRRSLLTEQLMLRANAEHAAGLGDRRSAPRHRDSSTRTVCRLPDGATVYVKILDMSVDGVSVESARKPAIGSEVHIGRSRGVVARHTPRGFVVLYSHSAAAAPERNLRAV